MMGLNAAAFILLTIFLLIDADADIPFNANKCKIKENEVSFMKKCYCKPGWESSVERPLLKCDKPIHHVDHCECGKHVDGKVVFSKDQAGHNAYIADIGGGMDEYGIRCFNLCRHTPEVGVAISHPNEWKDNLYWKQIGFYTKELRLCSLNVRHTHMRERLNEFAESKLTS